MGLRWKMIPRFRAWVYILFVFPALSVSVGIVTGKLWFRFFLSLDTEKLDMDRIIAQSERFGLFLIFYLVKSFKNCL